MCFGGGGEVKQDFTMQNRQADLAQRVEDDYIARYAPIEREALNYASDKSQINKQAGEAMKVAGDVFDGGRGTTERTLAGFGATLTDAQRQASNRLQGMAKNGAQIVAGNTVREAVANRQDKMGTQFMALGRQAKLQGIDGINSAAGMEGQRNNMALQQHAQQQAGKNQMLGTVVGIGASLAIASDKKAKQNIRSRSDDKDMSDVRSFKNYEYDYKPGMSGGRAGQRHIGGMAQEMPDTMSDGKQVDVGDVAMVAMGAIRNMDKRLQKMEKSRRG